MGDLYETTASYSRTGCRSRGYMLDSSWVEVWGAGKVFLTKYDEGWSLMNIGQVEVWDVDEDGERVRCVVDREGDVAEVFLRTGNWGMDISVL